jgi:cell division control protein 6
LYERTYVLSDKTVAFTFEVLRLRCGGILDEVFEKFMNNTKILKNREVLRHDYLPENLPHREEQIIQFGEAAAPVLNGERCSNILIYGKSGTGKTAVTKYVLNYLEMKTEKHVVPSKFCYVNCRLAGTEYRILANICKNINVSVPFTGLSTGEVFDRFKRGLDPKKIILIIALDEIDALITKHGDTLLYELTRVNETLSNSRVSLVGVSNDLRLKEYLEPRVLSSLSEEEIVFKPYDSKELKSILYERSKLAFYDGTLTDTALNLCAALAAAEHGDARRALDLLRVAGEVAERKYGNTVNEEHVREAEKLIEHNRVVEVLRSLTLHSKLVLASVFHLKKANITNPFTGQIYEVYIRLCEELGVTPLTQRRVSTLINELDILGLLNSKVVSMGRYGRTKKIQLQITLTSIRKVFSEDLRLQQVVNQRFRIPIQK